MPMTKENRRAFSRLRNQHGINFVEQLDPEQWPANHRAVFSAIEELKQVKYTTYLQGQTNVADLDSQPWKLDAKKQARQLAEISVDCLDRNESTWRHACEPLVFSRLKAEVAW